MSYGFESGPVVHIGLGKTATTTLQRTVFPEVPRLREVIYNPGYVMSDLSALSRGLVDPNLEVRVRSLVLRRPHFISLESLVDWNPRNWVEAADQNLRLFSKDATILITVRNTASYLKSVFAQVVHEGLVVPPEHFFVNKEIYDRVARTLPARGLIRFDVDAFDLEQLFKIYADRFRKVLMVPFEDIGELHFLARIFHFDEEQRSNLAQKFSASPAANRSYSRTTMAMTYSRERIFGVLGARSVSSMDTVVQELAQYQPRDFEGFRGKKSSRAFDALVKRLRWKSLMQGTIDKRISYRSYELPTTVYQNLPLARKNDLFIQRWRFQTEPEEV